MTDFAAIAGEPVRAASRDELLALNERARERGHRSADEAILRRMPAGANASGSLLGEPSGEGVVLVQFGLAPADHYTGGVAFALIEVDEAAWRALPEWGFGDASAAAPEGGGGTFVLPALVLSAAVLLTGVLRFVAPGAVTPVGVVLLVLGALVAAGCWVAILVDRRRTDYWDALDEFFGQLEVWYLGAAAAVVAAAGGVMLVLDAIAG